MKILVRAVGAGMVAGLLVLAIVWRMWTGPGPMDPAGQGLVPVRIPHGVSWSAAADSLAAHGLLAHPRLLTIMVRLLGDGPRLKAGLYDLPPGASPRTLTALLTAGRTVPVRVTLLEGWNAGEMAAELEARVGFPAAKFLAAADAAVHALAADSTWSGFRSLQDCDQVLQAGAADRAAPLHLCEGYLAPDTYLFAEGMGAAEAADHLVRTQLGRLVEVRRRPAPASAQPLDPHQLLTLASIVEAEARLDDERPLIAAVYRNRLQRGWRLEADPTVAYVLGRKGTRLFHRDLEVDSPYNTYRFGGLPPGPIGGPGPASLEAAGHPDTSCRALFFVSDGGLGHVFSNTAAEHARAVARFRAVRDRERRAAPER